MHVSLEWTLWRRQQRQLQVKQSASCEQMSTESQSLSCTYEVLEGPPPRFDSTCAVLVPIDQEVVLPDFVGEGGLRIVLLPPILMSGKEQYVEERSAPDCSRRFSVDSLCDT